MKFADELRARARSFRAAKIAARIQVPTDLSWWYFLEFGTASRRSSDAPYGGGATGTYLIKPIDRGNNSTLESLHWGPPGGGVFAAKVDHPGIRPHPFVRPSLSKIMQQFAADVAGALAREGFRANTVKQALINETMVFAKALLVANLAVAAPGTREDGNLLGLTAAEVFEEEAEITDAADFSPGGAGQFARRAAREIRKPATSEPPKKPRVDYDF